MATKTKTVVGLVTTYVVTDFLGGTVTLAVTQNPGSGNACTFTSTGSVHNDGLQHLAHLLQQLSTGLTP